MAETKNGTGLEKKSLYYAALAELVVVVIIATFYAFLGVLGKAPTNTVLFVAWLSVLNIFNGVFLFIAYLARSQLNFKTQVATLLWAGVFVWFWTVGPVYYLMTMRLNAEQFSWTPFAYFWEVPVIGGGLFILVALLVLRPIRRYMEGEYKPADPRKFYRRVLLYPIFIGVWIFFVAVLGYFIGAIQIRQFADLPFVEQVKNTLNGAATTFFLSAVFYLIFDRYLDRVRQKIEEEFNLRDVAFRKWIFRTFGVTFTATMGTIAVIGLLVFNILQGVVEQQLVEVLKPAVADTKADIERQSSGQEYQEGLQALKKGDRGEVFILGSGDNLEPEAFSADTHQFFLENDEGTTVDRRREHKVVTFFKNPRTEDKIVAVVYPSDFNHILSNAVNLGIGGGAFVIISAFLFSIVLASSLTAAIRKLNASVRQTRASGEVVSSGIHTGDEIEQLSHVIEDFAKSSFYLQKNLEKEVTAKTEELNTSVQSLKTKNEQLEGTKTAILNLLEDIDEEKKRALELQLRTEALLRSIGDGVVVMDNELNITFVNDAAARLFAVEKDELVGKNALKAIRMETEDEKKLPPGKRPLKLALDKAERQTVGLRDHMYYKYKRKERFPIALTITPVVVEGEVTGSIAVFRDITSEVQLDKAKTEFVSIASHQLRTPLTTINWYSDILKSGQLGKLNKEQMEYMEEIVGAGERMLSLVNALLNVSRIELGTFAVEPELVDLNKLMENIAGEFIPEATEKKVKIKKEYDKDIPKIKLDKQLIHVVFSNLISNAIKYTLGDKREVTVKTRKEKDKKNVIVSISDTGIGIPKKQEKRIFTKFFRADNAHAHNVNGTGLGLYVVKNIIDNANGEIWFETKEGEGTTFFVRLPFSGMKKRAGTRALISMKS